MSEEMKNKSIVVGRPSSLVSFVPLLVLMALLFLTITAFGDGALSGGSQVCLLVASAVCATIGMWVYRVPWKTFESAIEMNVKRVSHPACDWCLVGHVDGERYCADADILRFANYTSGLFPADDLRDLCDSFADDG